MQKTQIFIDETPVEPREVRLLKKAVFWCNLLMCVFAACFGSVATLFVTKELDKYNGIILLVAFTLLVVLSLLTKWLAKTRLNTIKNTG